jgi:hypothetical protein
MSSTRRTLRALLADGAPLVGAATVARGVPATVKADAANTENKRVNTTERSNKNPFDFGFGTRPFGEENLPQTVHQVI